METRVGVAGRRPPACTKVPRQAHCALSVGPRPTAEEASGTERGAPLRGEALRWPSCGIPYPQGHRGPTGFTWLCQMTGRQFSDNILPSDFPLLIKQNNAKNKSKIENSPRK